MLVLKVLTQFCIKYETRLPRKVIYTESNTVLTSHDYTRVDRKIGCRYPTSSARSENVNLDERRN